MSLLETIDSPDDLKSLSMAELQQVCTELRQYIIDVVTEIGGHFGSSLGAAELTVALHHLYDAPQDKIVWDVGHQAYGHKVLTVGETRSRPFGNRAGSVGSPCGVRAGTTPLPWGMRARRFPRPWALRPSAI